MVIYEVEANEYEKMQDLAHSIKKVACKLVKCIDELEEHDDDGEYDDEYEEEYEQSQLRRRGPRYRNEQEDPSRIQDPNEPVTVHSDGQVRTRRGRNSRGQYTSMRSRNRMPRSRYDIEVY